MAVSMMLDYLGETAAAEEIENVVKQLLADGSIPSLDTRSGITTSQTGDMVVERLRGE
jgi:isocitrate/isopropylmalate dehydrogenase